MSERNLCQRLSIPMEKLAHDAGFLEYRADLEYNRANDGRSKTIAGENFETVTYCDLTLHSRGRVADQDNLIAIEMKRRSHPATEKHKDRVRLITLTREPYEGALAGRRPGGSRVCRELSSRLLLSRSMNGGDRCSSTNMCAVRFHEQSS